MSENIQVFRILIDGMHCGNCATNVEKHLSGASGVKDVNVLLASNSGKVTYDADITTPQDVLKVFDELSFSATIVAENNKMKVLQERKAKQKSQQKRDVISFCIASIITIIVVAICMIPGCHMQFGHFMANLFGANIDSVTQFAESISQSQDLTHATHMFLANVAVMILTIPVQFILGWHFYVGAYKSIKSGMANMDVLVALGTTIAFLFSVYITFFDMSINDGMPYFETCCMLITFVMLGKILEGKAKSNAGDAVEKLMRLTPDKVIVIQGKNEVEKDIEDVFPGDVLLVKKGDSFPVDGEIVEGEATVDESMLTGEANAILKALGDKVSAGTTNLKKSVKVKALSVGGDTQLAHIIQAVEDAEGTKPKIQRTADKIASIFVPVIVGISIITFIGWCIIGSLQGEINIKNALLPAVAVICVACPCALGLATPTALMVGMGKGAENGILIKDGEMLEAACKINTCIFDKTGTLTTGVVMDTDDESVVVKQDELKSDTNEGIEELRMLDVTCWMVTGDKKDRALSIAKEAGINESNVVFEVLPTQKGEVVDSVRAKQPEENTIAFVGDGINDAPALAKADIGIAMQSGTDIAIDAGSIVLMHNSVLDVSKAIKLSKATMRKVKQNLFWALIYNCIMIPLAVVGILAPAVAGFAMAMSSVCVVGNSILLKRWHS